MPVILVIRLVPKAHHGERERVRLDWGAGRKTGRLPLEYNRQHQKGELNAVLPARCGNIAMIFSMLDAQEQEGVDVG
jgi:hypothetical protein